MQAWSDWCTLGWRALQPPQPGEKKSTITSLSPAFEIASISSGAEEISTMFGTRCLSHHRCARPIKTDACAWKIASHLLIQIHQYDNYPKQKQPKKIYKKENKVAHTRTESFKQVLFLRRSEQFWCKIAFWALIISNLWTEISWAGWPNKRFLILNPVASIPGNEMLLEKAAMAMIRRQQYPKSQTNQVTKPVATDFPLHQLRTLRTAGQFKAEQQERSNL